MGDAGWGDSPAKRKRKLVYGLGGPWLLAHVISLTPMFHAHSSLMVMPHRGQLCSPHGKMLLTALSPGVSGLRVPPKGPQEILPGVAVGTNQNEEGRGPGPDTVSPTALPLRQEPLQ